MCAGDYNQRGSHEPTVMSEGVSPEDGEGKSEAAHASEPYFSSFVKSEESTISGEPAGSI